MGMGVVGPHRYTIESTLARPQETEKSQLISWAGAGSVDFGFQMEPQFLSISKNSLKLVSLF